MYARRMRLCRAGHGLAFAEPFTQSALHLGRPRRPLQAEQPPDRIGDGAEEGVDRHAHAPMHQHSVAQVSTPKVIEPFVAE